MKTTRHSLLAKGIMVLLSLLVLVFAFTYSWFVPPDHPVNATGLSLSAQDSGVDFDIAIGFSNESTSNEYIVTDFQTRESGVFDFTQLKKTVNGNEKSYNLLRNYDPTDLTGNGSFLIRPAMLSKNSDIDIGKNTFEYGTPNEQYISFDLIIRSSSPNLSVKLDSGSMVLGGVEGNSKNASALIVNTATDSNRKSTYGNFSEDAVVGAVRLAFVDYPVSVLSNKTNIFEKLDTVNGTPNFIWIPRSDIFLKANTNSTSNWVLYKEGDSEWNNSSYKAVRPGGSSSDPDDMFTYQELSRKHYYYGIYETTPYSGGNQNYKLFDSDKTVYDLSTAKEIVDVNIPGGEGDSYFYGKCRVNIWIDGCDAEARRAIDKGQFKVVFSLST